MTLTDSGNGHKVTVDADDSFDHAVLWQQDAESFVCMEPERTTSISSPSNSI